MKAAQTISNNPVLAQPRPSAASFLRSAGAPRADFGELLADRAREPEDAEAAPAPADTAEEQTNEDRSEGADKDAGAPDKPDNAGAEPDEAERPALPVVLHGVDTIARELTHAATVDLAAVAQEELSRPHDPAKNPDKYPVRDTDLLGPGGDPRLSKTPNGGSGSEGAPADRNAGARNASPVPHAHAGPQHGPNAAEPDPGQTARTPEPASAEPAAASRSNDAARHATAAMAAPPASRSEPPPAADLAGRVARLERLAGSAEAVRGAVAGIERAGPTRVQPDFRPVRADAGQAGARSETGQRVLNAVQRGLASMLTHGGGRMTVVLRPEQLGEVRVRMETREGSVRASLTATTDAARRTLESGLDSLRAALESRGVRVESIEIDRADPQQSDRAGAETGADHKRREQRDGGHEDRAHTRSGTDERVGTDAPPVTRGIWTELGIDAVA